MYCLLSETSLQFLGRDPFPPLKAVRVLWYTCIPVSSLPFLLHTCSTCFNIFSHTHFHSVNLETNLTSEETEWNFDRWKQDGDFTHPPVQTGGWRSGQTEVSGSYYWDWRDGWECLLCFQGTRVQYPAPTLGAHNSSSKGYILSPSLHSHVHMCTHKNTYKQK